ncbi:conserved domain protein [Paenibacillus sp. HGF5]|nr:conserved domain protein [Paenibacillus sp. HGF5]
MLFDSARLSCRKMTMDDAELYHTWRNDLEVMQSTSPSLDTYQMEETKDFVQHVILGTPSSKSYLIQAKESGQPIGIMSLVGIDFKNRNAECIIDIGDKNYWGRGIRLGSDGAAAGLFLFGAESAPGKPAGVLL